MVVGQVNFLLFHTFSELFAIIISFMMFAVAWPTFSFSRNTILVFLAAGYFWVAVLDIFHTIVYKGMNLLPGADAYLSIDFWMGGRLLEAIVMILAPALCRRHINHNVLFAIIGTLTIGFITLVLLAPETLPTFFIEGGGLTQTKIFGEVALITMFVIAGALFVFMDTPLSSKERTLIVTAIALTIMAEAAFTRYTDVYGYYNFVGHSFKLFSFWMIFHSLVYSNLQRPYQKLQQVQRDSRLADVVLSNLHAGIWSYDPLYGRLSLNDAACQWLGCKTKDKMSLDTWINRVPEKGRKDVEEGFIIALKKAEPFEWIHQLEDSDGNERTLHITGRPIIENKNVVGLYGMMIDITNDENETVH